jgi:hypothetical protein
VNAEIFACRKESDGGQALKGGLEEESVRLALTAHILSEFLFATLVNVGVRSAPTTLILRSEYPEASSVASYHVRLAIGATSAQILPTLGCAQLTVSRKDK